MYTVFFHLILDKFVESMSSFWKMYKALSLVDFKKFKFFLLHFFLVNFRRKKICLLNIFLNVSNEIHLCIQWRLGFSFPFFFVFNTLSKHNFHYRHLSGNMLCDLLCILFHVAGFF